MTTPKEALELAKKHDVKYVDLKFIDFPGIWQHTQIPATRLNEGLFEDGLADGAGAEEAEALTPVKTPKITFRRLPYDFETTIRKIYSIAELEPFLGDRLRQGR